MPALRTGTTLPRPTDPDIIARVAEATRKGHPITTAGTLAGIGAATATQWYSRGLEQLETDGELGSHALFALAVKQAEAELVDSQLGVIQDAGSKGMWAAAMTLLERRFPQDFGRNQTVNVKQESLTVVLHGTLPPGAEHELIAQAHARLRAAQLQIEAGGASQDEATPPADYTLPEA
jgi:hypothetical protein